MPTLRDPSTPAGSRRASVAALRRRLLEHYDRHRRELPWRGERDPYRIWVSEVMLQQTRVETVIPYYRRWVERFPDLESLARADEDEVLLLWRGLGYYSRARNLRRAAAVVRDRHGGEVPPDVRQLARLPGVGAYTAGAVASIAFGAAEPAIDGNARRVLSRLFDLPAPAASELRARAARLLDRERPGDFNQALMELGATVCTPRSPLCAECPLSPGCLARARGTVALRPTRGRRARAPERAYAVAVLADPSGRLLLVRRPPSGLLGGLWAFPEVEVGDEGRAVSAARELARSLGFVPSPRGGGALPPVRHAFTHLRARYLPVLLRVPAERMDALSRHSGRWVDPSGLDEVALPAAQQRIAAAAAERVSGTEHSRRTPRELSKSTGEHRLR